jgi:hypothetical protein
MHTQIAEVTQYDSQACETGADENLLSTASCLPITECSDGLSRSKLGTLTANFVRSSPEMLGNGRGMALYLMFRPYDGC